MRQVSPSRSARVRMAVVSDPAAGSVTPKACNRLRPSATRGRYRCFCSSEPWRSSVPITYIWAWQALGLPPLAEISSTITDAPARLSPPPP